MRRFFSQAVEGQRGVSGQDRVIAVREQRGRPERLRRGRAMTDRVHTAKHRMEAAGVSPTSDRRRAESARAKLRVRDVPPLPPAMAATHGLTFFSVSENFVRHALERAARGVTREAANVTT